jgi:hypothetical protein
MRLLSPVVFALVTTLLGPASARADGCKRVRTTIVTSFFSEGCQSLLGICTRGRVRSGLLKGTSSFTAQSIAPGPGASLDVLLYTGELVITTRKGTVTLHDYGLLDSLKQKYFETQHVVAGTEAFDQATGALTSQGSATVTGFKGTLEGAICRNEREQPEDAEELADSDEADADFDAADADFDAEESAG